MKGNFVEQGKSEMNAFVVKAIEDLLEVLDSEIVYPEDKDGNVVEHRLLQVVKSREQVYLSTMNLIDLIDIGSKQFMKRIIDGLKTTWHELTIITTRNIGNYNPLINVLSKEKLTEEKKKELARQSVEDNYLSSIAQAKELSAKVAFQILDRIEKLEMTDDDKEKQLIQEYSGRTAEKFARKYADA